MEGKGGIPKVDPPLYEEGPPQRRRRSSSQSNLEIWPHAKNEDSCTVWRLFSVFASDFWFPPYMRKAPSSSASGAVWDPISGFGHM